MQVTRRADIRYVAYKVKKLEADDTEYWSTRKKEYGRKSSSFSVSLESSARHSHYCLIEIAVNVSQTICQGPTHPSSPQSLPTVLSSLSFPLSSPFLFSVANCPEIQQGTGVLTYSVGSELKIQSTLLQT